MSQFEVTLPGGVIAFIRSGKIRRNSFLFRIFPPRLSSDWFHGYLVSLTKPGMQGSAYHLLRNREGNWVERSFPAFATPPDEPLRHALQKAIEAYEHSR